MTRLLFLMLVCVVTACASRSTVDVARSIECAAVAQRYVHKLNEASEDGDLANAKLSLDVWMAKLEAAYGGDVDALVKVNKDVWAELRAQERSSPGTFGDRDAALLADCRKQESIAIDV